jgi:NAD(P)H-flavin reductase/ferredoxin
LSVRIEYRGVAYELRPGETLLDGLGRHGVRVPSFCRTGACQTCLLRATSGRPPAGSQDGLAETLLQQGCFLACQCVPDEPLQVEPCDAVNAFETRVANVRQLTPRVLCVELDEPDGFEYRAGQFLQLGRQGVASRPYSIASLPGSGRLELHVAIRAGGVMSQWLCSATNQRVTLRGPFGECFYVEGEPERPLLLAGTGTGLAPLLGVTRAALAAGHRGPIHLYHGSTHRPGLYLFEQLERLAQASPGLRVFGSLLPDAGDAAASGAPPVVAGDAPCQVLHEPLDRLILADPLDFFDCRVYLCGDPELVRRLRQRVYLSGAPRERIHCDPFAAPADGRSRFGPRGP